MALFSQAQMDKINAVAAKSVELLDKPQKKVSTSVNDDIINMSSKVVEYFQDSKAILITSKEQLHDYISKCIEFGYAGIDTETTGLDRIKDTIVGASLFVPGMPECYIPMKHLVPIFDTPYKGQLSYEDVGQEFQRFVSENVKLIFANADFDLSMIYKDLKCDLVDAFHYDVILAWRCLKENEKDNALKVLYNKYVLKGSGDPKKFSDFFTPDLFPYCKPEVAKYYAANDAKISYELFRWQLPYVTKSNARCKKHHLEAIADLIWNIEFPLVKVCQNMHRSGMYLDKDTAKVIQQKYRIKLDQQSHELRSMVDDIISSTVQMGFKSKRPFTSGNDFNPKSTLHVRYLVYDLLKVPQGREGQTTKKEFLRDLNIPVINKILDVRSLETLINTFVDKLPKSTTSDSRIHAIFNSVGASTGRFSSQSPNLQNIPSHAKDIRHIFRATPEYEDCLECDVSENFISVNLPRWFMVKSGDCYKSVKDVIVGDIIEFMNDDKVVYKNILEIHECIEDSSMIQLVTTI